MRVALVHECLMGFHGSERVLAELAAMFPAAPIHLLVHHRAATRGTPLEGRTFHTSLLDRVPILRRRHRLLLPLMPYAIEQLDLRGHDVVISSHHTAAHGVLVRGDQRHVVYTHSPARYAWDLYGDHFPPGTRAPIRRYLLHRFRRWDQLAGRRPDQFLANSAAVARRIRRVYRRDAAVVHPPVAIDRFDATRPRDGGYIALGRLVPYKRVDVVAGVFADRGWPLTVIGDGPARGPIRRLADAGRLTWEPRLDDAAVADRLARCRGVVFAGEEDFGIGLVEAQASGAPVIALGRGGAAEIVRPDETGVLFGGEQRGALDDASLARGLADAVERAEALPLDAEACRANARRFGVDVFRRGIQSAVAG